MFQENAYLVWPADAKAAFAVDPGLEPHAKQILASLRQWNLDLAAILVTHAHIDHIAGIAALYKVYPKAAIIAPHAESKMLGDAVANMSKAMGMIIEVPAATRLVDPGDVLKLASLEWKTLDVSGHSPGGLAYYCSEAGVVFTGDALFAGCIGRTDFPGGSTKQLIQNIKSRLLSLPLGTIVYSGHGPVTTVAAERAENPWLQDNPPP